MLLESASASIMIVDDSRVNLHLLELMLSKQHYSVHSFRQGEAALQWAAGNPPDLILLDVIMPGMDGFELCARLKGDKRLKDIPVIFISAMNDLKTKVRAFGLGAVDYITKPFEMEELHTRVRTHLQTRNMQVRLTHQNQELERQVEQKVREISESQLATILALAKLAESRDDETGNHLERVQILCAVLAEHLSGTQAYRGQIDRIFITDIYHASPLHDIGKVGIPDRILLKPGRLDPDEFEIMKTHSVIGSDTLEAVRRRYRGNAFIDMGISIARWHHERWDGCGYPDGLAGEKIPLCARIMAVADVYDALRSERCYKKAMTHMQALEIISEGRGCQFSPDIVNAMLALGDQLQDIFENIDRYMQVLFD